MKLAVVGGGWAGMAAAVGAAGPGIELTVFEAARELGGRARALQAMRPDGVPLLLDNGQHILIGAYSQALACMHRVGVSLPQSLLSVPLGLPFPDGSGLQTSDRVRRWPAPWALTAAVLSARGWTWSDRLSLLRVAVRWQHQDFACDDSLTVADISQGLSARIMVDLIEPLCVSALNLPTRQASGQVFLRVLKDTLMGSGFGPWRASDLLLPRADLSTLFPQTAAHWLQGTQGQGFKLHTGTRVTTLRQAGQGWRLMGAGIDGVFDQVIWATAAPQAAQVMKDAAQACDPQGMHPNSGQLQLWADRCSGLAFTAITTVYAWSKGLRLERPMLALRDGPDAPAQFVFDRGQLCPEDATMQGVLAFVISNSQGERSQLQQSVMRQATQQLGIGSLQPVQTVVEKRATFACLPGQQRPTWSVAAGLQAAGDYIEGPYPATLESAVRAGWAAGERVARLATPV